MKDKRQMELQQFMNRWRVRQMVSRAELPAFKAIGRTKKSS